MEDYIKIANESNNEKDFISGCFNISPPNMEAIMKRYKQPTWSKNLSLLYQDIVNQKVKSIEDLIG